MYIFKFNKPLKQLYKLFNLKILEDNILRKQAITSAYELAMSISFDKKFPKLTIKEF